MLLPPENLMTLLSLGWQPVGLKRVDLEFRSSANGFRSLGRRIHRPLP
jgi:hypothetical protein